MGSSRGRKRSSETAGKYVPSFGNHSQKKKIRLASCEQGSSPTASANDSSTALKSYGHAEEAEAEEAEV